MDTMQGSSSKHPPQWLLCGLKRNFSTSPELNVSVSRTALCVDVGELFQQGVCGLNTLTPHVSTQLHMYHVKTKIKL